MKRKLRSELEISNFEIDESDLSTNEMKFLVFSYLFGTNNEKKVIKIREITSKKYGLHIWDSSIVLSLYLFSIRKSLQKKYVLELGAGCGLPSLLACCLGNRVIISDKKENKKILNNLFYEINQLNNLEKQNIIVKSINWGDFPKITGLNLIIASDCFFNPKDFENFLVTASYLLKINENCSLIASYVIRNEEDSIELLLEKYGLVASEIPLNFLTMENFKSVFFFHPNLFNEKKYWLILSSIRLFYIRKNVK